jgi:hypothetical protein
LRVPLKTTRLAIAASAQQLKRLFVMEAQRGRAEAAALARTWSTDA